MKTKKIFQVILIAIAILGSHACSDYLDQVPVDKLSTDKVFETKSSTLSFLASVYTYIPDEFNQRFVCSGSGQATSGAWTGGCDEAEYVWGFVGSHLLNNNSLTVSEGFVYDFWHKYYKGINAATKFIQNVDKCPDLSEAQINQWKSEARALRAIYYYYLLRLYGPVPVLGDRIISQNTSLEDLQIPRSTVEECGNFILSELQKAIDEGLIENIKATSSTAVGSSDRGIGHIDQAIAKAFKVETRLLLASPLFTGQVPYFSELQNNDGTKLFPSYSDEEKKQMWQAAAKEAKEFIDKFVGNGFGLNRIYTNGVLDPYLSYREAVRGDKNSLSSNEEMIFCRVSASVSTAQYDRTPYHLGAPNNNGGYRAAGGLGATQEIVDAYFMANGLKPILGYEADQKTPIINEASGYVESGFSTEDYVDSQTGQLYAPAGVLNAWVNREPRFYADITFSGQRWLYDADGPMYTYTNYSGNSGKKVGVNDYSPTGYIVRKSAPLGSWRESNRVCILLRVAQIYLDYAEALNESDPGNPDILKYLNLIRQFQK